MTSADLNDSSFVKRVVGGDVDAFRLLFDRLAVPLSTFIRRMGVDAADAEELAADTLLKVHKSVHTFRADGGAKLSTWIFEIAKNCALDHVKAQNRHDGHEAFWLEFFRVPPTSQAPTALAGSSASKIQEAIATLSQDDQDILRQRLVMDYEEIAVRNGATVGALRVRHKRALDRLKKEMGKV